ncbi:MAG: PQQ-binding-like beta-propeller repeat protein [Planctomycetaceae bacterium]
MRFSLVLTSLRLCATTAVLIASATGSPAENWVRFRGTDGRGASPDKGVPATWSPGEYAFNIELPGEGHSAPVIFGDRLFVTSAEDEGTIRHLFCLNSETGKTLWSKTTGMNKSEKHVKSSWASASPTTDGKLVYVAFADADRYSLTAYDYDGNLVWRKMLGPYESQHGLGASPILFENLVIAANDQDGPSSIVALDRETGRLVWSTLRPAAAQATSYATPFILERNNAVPLLICSSSQAGVTGLDPRTGREVWTTGPLPARTVGSPIEAGGLIFQACGGGGRGKEMIGIDPSGQGNIAKTHIKQKREKIVPYVPTPVVNDNHIYLWTDDGVVTCTEIESGNDVWKQRIGGNFSGSPICVDDRIYIVNEKGEVIVVGASPEYKLYGKMPLGDPSHSTPAAANGRLYFRTFHRVICIDSAGAKKKVAQTNADG